MRKLLLLLTLVLPLTTFAQVRVGADLYQDWLPKLEGKKVAVLANHTACLTDSGEHIVDFMVKHGINIVGIISPEHGFRGQADAGEKVASGVDPKTGIPIWSLYSSKGNTLSAENLASFDVAVVDMQDVGLRFYTYYITMLKVIEQCGMANHKVIIFDRPNPNGMVIDGPVLDLRFKSGVGALPIPIFHGLTMGEIALMAIGEKWCQKCEVEVVKCQNYNHQTRYTLPISPSPNLKSQHAIYLYGSTCLFEGTICSLGRGTYFPFEVYGHPNMSGCNFSFTPHSTAGAKYPPLCDKKCYGMDLRAVDSEEIINKGFNLDYIIDAYNRTKLGEKFFTPFFEKLVGVDYIRPMIIGGATASKIRSRWQAELEQYRVVRKKYLLYAE